MSDPTQLAKSARELLASALNALQSNAQVPEELMAVAEPIAEAMGTLHRIERSNGKDLEGRDEALVHVRGALDALQKVDAHHPALDTVMEAVATSLSKVHALTRVPKPAASAPAPVAPPPAPRAAPPAPIDVPPPPAELFAKANAALASEGFPAPPAAGAAGPRGTMAMQPSPASAPVKTPFTALPAQDYVQQAKAQAHAPAAVPATPAPAQQAPPAPASRAPVPAPTPVMQQQQQPASRAPAPSQKGGGSAGSIDVELGTHSTSNFYKGLGGNDVIDHGGIFVATYKIPKIGATVALRVLLPGDLEFSAKATVQWTREASGSTEPGYGARFTQITQEGRHLVYRYTRNREPMFYDDL
jgi:hypothetical protein